MPEGAEGEKRKDRKERSSPSDSGGAEGEKRKDRKERSSPSDSGGAEGKKRINRKEQSSPRDSVGTRTREAYRRSILGEMQESTDKSVPEVPLRSKHKTYSAFSVYLLDDKESQDNEIFWEPAYHGDKKKDWHPAAEGQALQYIIREHRHQPQVRVFKGVEYVESHNVIVEGEDYVLKDKDGKRHTFKYLSELASAFKKAGIEIGEPINRKEDPIVRITDIERCADFAKSRKNRGDFKLEEEKLGEGNFGKVKVGELEGKKVAVKMIPQVSNDFVTGVMEVAVMLDLDHPNLVRLCGWRFEGKTLYIITELVRGETLRAYVQKAKKKYLSSLGLTKIVLGIAEGLQYLEARKLVHRDLAARNIFLDTENNPKIGDFGLCRREGSRYPCGEMAVKWSAPEILKSKENYSTKSDIWSYGIVLWEVYSLGHVPFFDMENEKLGEALKKAFDEDRCPLEFPENTPENVRGVARECLQEDPSSRPDCKDIIGKLKERPPLPPRQP